MAIKDRKTPRIRTTPARKKAEAVVEPRFVLTPEESERILEVLANPPAPLTDEAKRRIGDYKRVKVTLSV